MKYFETVTGESATHIGFNPEVGKEVYRVGEELIYTDKDGMIAGYPFIIERKGHCIVLFHGGYWSKFTEERDMERETDGQDIYRIIWVEDEE